MFDSTWSTLPKRDSDALMACYGDKQNVVDAFTFRRMALDTSENLVKVIDGILDTLTDGEHSRTIKQLEGNNTETEEEKSASEVFELFKCPISEII
jgi:bromodomain-containing protein 7/9